MAAARHNLSRRALLGAGAAACAFARDSHLLTVPIAQAAELGGHVRVPVPASSSRWARALAGYGRAEARQAAFRRAEAALPPEARAWPHCEALDERSDTLECARLAALRRLLRLPAPDLSAFALKIELTVDDQAWELAGAEPCLAALKADARRLACGG